MKEQLIADLSSRYATKKYDSTKKISAEDLLILKQAIQLSPTSVGLQAFTVIELEDVQLRKELKTHAYNQDQLTDSSTFFIFCIPEKVNETHVDEIIDIMSEKRAVTTESLGGYRNMVLNNINSQDTTKNQDWLSKQVYIALGFLLQTAAHLNIDATPMEGFKNEEFDAVLNLKELGLKSVVACALGYRHPEDKYQHLKKVRKPLESLFIKK
jgi:nitroreductase